MMYVGAVAVVFYSLSTLSNGLLQGIDRLKVPVINAAISIVAHVIVLILLMLIFRLNIHAVVLANTFFALLMCFMNSMALKKYSGFKQEIKKTFINIFTLCQLKVFHIMILFQAIEVFIPWFWFVIFFLFRNCLTLQAVLYFFTL